MRPSGPGTASEAALDVDGVAREGSAAAVLEDESALCDLLVLGSPATSASAACSPGSVSRHCLHHAHSPLVVLGPDAHQDATSRLVLSSTLDPDRETIAWVVDRLRFGALPIHVISTFEGTMGLAELAVTDAQQAIRASVRAEHDLWVRDLEDAVDASGVDPVVVTGAVLEGGSLTHPRRPDQPG